MATPTDQEIGAAVRPLLVLLGLLRPVERDDDLLPLEAAARIAATSVRVVSDAIYARELPAFGRRRDRSVRRSDLAAWIESRRVVHAPIDDKNVDAEMETLRKEKLRAANDGGRR